MQTQETSLYTFTLTSKMTAAYFGLLRFYDLLEFVDFSSSQSVQPVVEEGLEANAARNN